MGKRGPAPKPEIERKLEGNPGKRAVSKAVDEDDLSFGSLRMPTRMSEFERAVWKDTLGAFPSWYFKPADKYLLIAYCRAVVRLEKSESALKNKSAVQTRANGSPCLSPHVAIINTAVQQVMSLSESLGLTRRVRKGILPPDPLPAPPQSQLGADGLNTPDGDDQDIPDSLIAPAV